MGIIPYFTSSKKDNFNILDMRMYFKIDEFIKLDEIN